MNYLGSDIACFVLYHVARYRRKVVRDNLVQSFPEKTVQEIKKIEKQFYHNFCDIIVESIKVRKMTSSELLKRVHVNNPELLEELAQKGRSVLLAMHHSSNWEWFWQIQHTVSSHRHFAVYKKLENRFFDRKVFQMRTQNAHGQKVMLEDRKVKDEMEQLKDSTNAILLLGDQSPRGAATDYWTEFLHRDTCWYIGLEYLAKKYDYAVVYTEMTRTARGEYSVTFKLICEDPKSTEDGFILKQYVRHVERFIQQYPDNWLWSHRRWKHARMQ